MSDDLDDLIDEETEETTDAQAPEAEAAPETPPAENEEADEEASDDETETDEAEAEASADEAPPAKQKDPKQVPLSVFLDNQNKLKAELEAKSKELDEVKAKSNAAPDFQSFFKAPPENVPSVLDDEAGYNAAQTAAMEAASYNTRFGISANYAVNQFGQEVVSSAVQEFQAAAEQNPALQQALENSFDPVGEIVNWSNNQRTLRTITDAGGIEAYEKNLREKIIKELSENPPPKKKAKANGQAETDEAPQIPNMPGNFNKSSGGGGNKSAPLHSDLDDLLG